MSKQQNSPFTLLTGASTIYANRLVKLSSGLVVHNTATATDVPVGVTQIAQATSGQPITVRDIKTGGTAQVTAAGAISKGADIFAAANGKVQALPEGAGTYRKVGVALFAATTDGDIIEAWLTPQGDTETVSGS